MKKSVFLLSILLIVALVSTCICTTTIAKYKTDLKSTAKTAVVAKWIDSTAIEFTVDDLFKFEYGDDSFYLAKTTEEGAIIAPGLSASSAIKIDLGETAPEVAYKATITKIEVVQSTGIPLQFYVGASTDTPSSNDFESPVNNIIDLTNSGNNQSNPISAGDTLDELDLCIFWQWAWDDETDESYLADIINAGVSVTVTATIEQINAE